MGEPVKGFKVLVVDDDYVVRSSLEEHLESLDSVGQIVHAENGKRGLAWLSQESFDIVFLDIDLPMVSGMDVLRQTSHQTVSTKYVLMTAYGRIPDAVEAVQLGAFTYLEKPLKPQAVSDLVRAVESATGLLDTVCSIAPISFEEGREMLGSAKQMEHVLELISKMARVVTPVLIQGESGTGKELVARAIHFNSSRRERAFVSVNCSAVQESLFESEFFGHEKGSFTGADDKKIGRFQFAEGGSLFLDEIGDLSLANQVKLLRVLQEKKFSPVGSNLEIPYDVRIVAATHKDLEKMVERGSFRQDLYFRLNILSLQTPSLRERKSDIPDLIKSFIEKFNGKHSKKMLGWRPGFLEAVLSYSFPGNIRELENAIERCFVLGEGSWLELEDLPPQMLDPSQVDPSQENVSVDSEQIKDLNKGMTPEIKVNSENLDFQKGKEEFEKKFIVEALKRNNGRLNQTALQANIPKKTLQRKIQKYGIDLTEFKK